MYGLAFANIFIIYSSGQSSSFRCFYVLITFAFIATEISLMITLIVFYLNNIKLFETVNIELLKYAVDYNCTDGPLQRVLKFIVGDF